MSVFVSVVIPVLDGEEMIGDLLRALGEQSAAPDRMEIIVVDNGSTDSTRDIVRGVPGVELLEEPVRGPSAARNRGLRHARGDVVAHLDADTLPTRRWLAEIVTPFADPEIVVVTGKTVAYRPTTGAERYTAAAGLMDSDQTVRRDPFPLAASGNMAVRREAALSIGGWNEDMYTGEDADFSHRLRKAVGCEIVYAPRAVLFHRHRSTDDQLRRQARTYGEGAARLYLRYPDEVRWDARKSMVLAGRLAVRTVLPPALRVARLFGLADPERVEFAWYHRLWTWQFWRGFAREYRRGRSA